MFFLSRQNCAARELFDSVSHRMFQHIKGGNPAVHLLSTAFPVLQAKQNLKNGERASSQMSLLNCSIVISFYIYFIVLAIFLFLSKFCLLTDYEFPQRQAGRWRKTAADTAERGRHYLLSQTERLCSGMSRWWIWLALWWHRHIRRKARTPHCSPLPPPPPSPSLNTSFSLPLCSHEPSCVNQHNLSSPLSTQRSQQYGSSMWPGSRAVSKVHNQGNKCLTPPRWTSDLM